MKSILKQRGGFVLGLIVGLLLGLAVALGVALYVTKVPVPLMNKTPPRTPEQDAAEAQKNKGWDPNAALSAKQSPRPAVASPASGAAPATPGPASEPRPMPLAEGQRPPPVLPPPVRTEPPPAPGATPAAATRSASEAGASAKRDPAAILNGVGTGTGTETAKATVPDNYTYWVQIGAYAKPEDAEQQRAKLAMEGVQAKVSERDQNGRPVHRVRLGPFDTREEAEAQRLKIAGSQPEASLVRVERGKP
jgi:cell division protein FtsN